MSTAQRIVQIVLDERTIATRSPQVEHERRIAVYDLVETNRFQPRGDFTGPYVLHLSAEEGRLTFDIRAKNNDALTRFTLSLAVLRKVIKDYFLICESYREAIKTASPSRIEAIDMGRRGLHNEGAELLREHLEEKAELDVDTARRMFTLVCALHLRL